MRLKKDSIWVFIYKFVYNTENLPNSLCPYFWKLLLACVLVVPYTIFIIPAIIIALIEKKDINTYDLPEKVLKSVATYLIVILGSVILYGTYHMIKAIFHCYSYNRDAAITMSIIYIVITIAASIVFLVNHINNKLWERRYNKKKQYILIEFIKAKYNKYCPKIDWN